MTVTSGRKCLESYGNSGPLGSLVRMCLESSIWRSTRCLLTWKRKDMKPSRSLFQLAVSTPRTEDTESPLLPTLTASDANGTHGGNMTGSLRTWLHDHGNHGQVNPEFAEWFMGYEQQFTKLIPTPTATDYRGGCLSRYWRPDSQTVQVEREREREQEGLRRPAEKPCGSHSPWEAWPDEPCVGRVAHGVSNRVDRIKCLGNAVVPQQFYPFFAAIAEIEQENK